MTVVTIGERGLASARLRGLLVVISLTPEGGEFSENEEGRRGIRSDLGGSGILVVERVRPLTNLTFQRKAGTLRCCQSVLSACGLEDMVSQNDQEKIEIN